MARPAVSLGTDNSFLVLFFKKEQNFFFKKKKQKTFICLLRVYSAAAGRVADIVLRGFYEVGDFLQRGTGTRQRLE
jgi:hypothetical protein